MIKIFILLLAFGLSTLTTLLMNLDATWKTVLGIAGFGLLYILLMVIIFFIFAFVATFKIKKDEIAKCYGARERKLFNNFVILGMSLFGIKLVANGLGKIPQNSNFVLLQNHVSNLDPMITNILLKKYPLIFVSKKSLFHIPFFGKFISRIGYVKLRRTACIEDAREIERGIKFVTENQCSLAVYPEGTRNKTYPYPSLLDFKEGTFVMATKCQRPIVVTVIHDSQLVKHLLLLKVHKVQIDIVGVINPEEYNNLTAEQLSKKVKQLMLDNIDNPINKTEFKKLF